MKPNAILIVFLVLAMLTSQAFSWWWSSGSSPAGGPSGNPNAVVCKSYRSRNQVKCTKGGREVTCVTKPPAETDDEKNGGPTPLGEYLIGKRYTNPTYGIDWYNLYPKKEDSSGYYGYTQRTQKGRYAMGLHPGIVSKGCVTVLAPLYNDDPCWKRIRNVVDSGTMQYRGSGYSGFLFVE